jgi:C6 transcription factor Pro1
LGSTMLGKSPQFAHTYRAQHLSGSGSGLCELMGCEDRVMYLISEISCLEALKLEGRVDDIELCSHITALAKQLDHTEPAPGSLSYALPDAAALRPRQLSKSMTALFRLAARIYLCSLVPGFDCHQSSTVKLVVRFAETLELIPGGSDGFDRSLVWPLLICGSFSTPTSPFRTVFKTRIELLGEQAEFGSFGRMVRLLQEVWRTAGDSEPLSMTDVPFLPTPVSAVTTPGGGLRVVGEEELQPKRQIVHWRDVMQQNGWEYLLI